MLCPRCQTQNADGCTVCARCGAVLTANRYYNSHKNASSYQPIQTFPQNHNTHNLNGTQSLYNAPAVSKKTSGSTIAAIICSSVGGLIIVVLLIVLLSPGVRNSIFGSKTKSPIKLNGDTNIEQNVVTDDFADAHQEADNVSDDQFLSTDNSSDIESTLPNNEETDKPITSSHTVLKVTSKIGLNVRRDPDTSSPVVAVLTQNSYIFVDKVDGGWAYVDFGDIKGWCSLDYLENVSMQGGYNITQSDLDKSLNDANLIIDSYRGKTPSNPRTDISIANVTDYFDSCQGLFLNNRSFGDQFEKLIPIAADSEKVYFVVEDKDVKTVSDLCDRYFSCFSDDIAEKCLKNRVFTYKGKLIVGFISQPLNSYHISHSYDVNAVSTDEFEVVVYSKEYSKTSLVRDRSGKPVSGCPVNDVTYKFHCVFEDGSWVFNDMIAVFE